MTEQELQSSGDKSLNPFGQATLRGLMRTWMDFERQLAKVPILRRLDLGTFSLEDYQRLLLNLRAQVVEGAGGIISDWQGKSFLNEEWNGCVLAAASKELHDKALELLNKK